MPITYYQLQTHSSFRAVAVLLQLWVQVEVVAIAALEVSGKQLALVYLACVLERSHLVLIREPQ